MANTAPPTSHQSSQPLTSTPSPPITCQICARQPSPFLKFTCQTCLQRTLYTPRYLHAKALLERESLSNTLNAALTLPRQDEHLARLQTAVHAARLKQRIREKEERTRDVENAKVDISAELDRIREDLRVRKGEVLSARKRIHELRRGFDALRKEGREEKVKRRVEGAESVIAKLERRIVDARGVMRGEVATTHCLSRTPVPPQPKSFTEAVQYRYFAGGIPLLNLADLSQDPAVLNASCERIVSILVVLTGYLSVQLPCEIVPPSINSAVPAILSPQGSYKFPTLALRREKEREPETTRGKVLFIDRPLSQLAREDRASYDAFVDAVAILAWDVAWLCASQGLDVSAEEMGDVGGMLWRFMHGDGIGKRDHVSPASESTSLASRSAGKEMEEWSERNSLGKFMGRIRGLLSVERAGEEWEVVYAMDERVAATGREVRVSGNGNVKEEGRGWMKVRGRRT